jgi:hypothetical protein
MPLNRGWYLKNENHLSNPYLGMGDEIQNLVKKCMTSPSFLVLKLIFKIFSYFKKIDEIIWNYKSPVKSMTKTFYAVTFGKIIVSKSNLRYSFSCLKFFKMICYLIGVTFKTFKLSPATPI